MVIRITRKQRAYARKNPTASLKQVLSSGGGTTSSGGGSAPTPTATVSSGGGSTPTTTPTIKTPINTKIITPAIIGGQKNTAGKSFIYQYTQGRLISKTKTETKQEAEKVINKSLQTRKGVADIKDDPRTAQQIRKDEREARWKQQEIKETTQKTKERPEKIINGKETAKIIQTGQSAARKKGLNYDANSGIVYNKEGKQVGYDERHPNIKPQYENWLKEKPDTKRTLKYITIDGLKVDAEKVGILKYISPETIERLQKTTNTEQEKVNDKQTYTMKFNAINKINQIKDNETKRKELFTSLTNPFGSMFNPSDSDLDYIRKRVQDEYNQTISKEQAGILHTWINSDLGRTARAGKALYEEMSAQLFVKNMLTKPTTIAMEMSKKDKEVAGLKETGRIIGNLAPYGVNLPAAIATDAITSESELDVVQSLGFGILLGGGGKVLGKAGKVVSGIIPPGSYLHKASMGTIAIGKNILPIGMAAVEAGESAQAINLAREGKQYEADALRTTIRTRNAFGALGYKLVDNPINANLYYKGRIKLDELKYGKEYNIQTLKDGSQIIDAPWGEKIAIVNNIHNNEIQGDMKLTKVAEAISGKKFAHSTTGLVGIKTGDKILLTKVDWADAHWRPVADQDFYMSIPTKNNPDGEWIRVIPKDFLGTSGYGGDAKFSLFGTNNKSIFIDDAGNYYPRNPGETESQYMRRIRAEPGIRIPEENVLHYTREPQVVVKAQGITKDYQRTGGDIIEITGRLGDIYTYSPKDPMVIEMGLNGKPLENTHNKIANYVNNTLGQSALWDKSGLGRNWTEIEVLQGKIWNSAQDIVPETTIRDRPTAIIKNKDGDYLMVKDSKTGQWELIGGGQEPTKVKYNQEGIIGGSWKLEDEGIALKKEILGELDGIVIKNMEKNGQGLIGDPYDFRISRGDQTITHKVSDWVKPWEVEIIGTPKIKGGENAEVAWIKQSDFENININPNHLKAIDGDFITTINTKDIPTITNTKSNIDYSPGDYRYNQKTYTAEDILFPSYGYSIREDLTKRTEEPIRARTPADIQYIYEEQKREDFVPTYTPQYYMDYDRPEYDVPFEPEGYQAYYEEEEPPTPPTTPPPPYRIPDPDKKPETVPTPKGNLYLDDMNSYSPKTWHDGKPTIHEEYFRTRKEATDRAIEIADETEATEAEYEETTTKRFESKKPKDKRYKFRKVGSRFIEKKKYRNDKGRETGIMGQIMKLRRNEF